MPIILEHLGLFSAYFVIDNQLVSVRISPAGECVALAKSLWFTIPGGSALGEVKTRESSMNTKTLLGVLVSLLASYFMSSTSLIGACTEPPSGIVAWWRAEGDATDQAGTNNGTLTGTATFGPGEVGQAFVFNGTGDGVLVGNPASLRLQDFSLEAWISRASTFSVSPGGGDGEVFCYGPGGYAFGLHNTGKMFLSKVDVDEVSAGTAITDTNFHHIAVTKLGTNVVFYLDGVSSTDASYNTTFTFSTPVAIGKRGDNTRGSFLGSIDELTIYNRALSAAEVQAIYNADGSGKCFTVVAAVITSQPTNQTVLVGGTASFSVTATGTSPLSYQWRFNGAGLTGQTGTSLMLVNVQFTNAGSYSVVVSNYAGPVVSSNAVLTVNPIPPCVAPPAGLVSWWRAEGDAIDQAGTNNGTLIGNTTYGPGRVGQAFVFDGNGDAVRVGNPANLQLQDLTIEAWIRRASTTAVTVSGGDGEIFCYGSGGYAFGFHSTGRMFFGKVDVDEVAMSTPIADTNFHHVAVTKVSSNVVFYVDGVAYGVPSYNPTFAFSTPAAVGARGDNIAASFLGSIDELTIYNRALSAAEVQAIYNADGSGKCFTVVAAVITSQPTNQTVLVGGTASFSVTATGTSPLSYQWRFNGAGLTGQTGTSLMLVNVQFTNAGSYSVVVSNYAGPVSSSNAVLTVNPLPPCVVPPMGLVSWWRAESNALDSAATNNGTLIGNTTYGPGRVGQAFVFDGSGDAVGVGNPANLQLQNLTIEAWIKRASTTAVTVSGGDGEIFCYGSGGYAFGFHSTGRMFFGKVDVDEVAMSTPIADTNFHHVAVTKVSSNVVFYVDGVAYGVPSYNPTFAFSTPAAVGARGDNIAASFLGSIDELTIYNRALSAAEVQAIYNADGSGKCVNHPPTASNLFAATKQNQGISIPTDKLLLFASDPDGDPLTVSGVSATSTNGGTASMGSGVVNYTPVTGYIGADRFTYTVSDGRGGTASAFVLLQVRSADQPSGNMFSPAPVPGGYLVSFAGIPNRTYTLERATNVSGPWMILAPVTANSNGIGRYTDTDAPPVSAFYRTIYP